MQTEHLLTPRKSPKQDRSKETVRAILEATARVLVKDGYDKTSTNRVAKIAGVSIGSLYQYFPSKESLVAALIHAHCEQMVGLLGDVAQAMIDAPLPVAVRAYVRAMLAAHAVDPELHQVLFSQGMQLVPRMIRNFERQSLEMVRTYLEHRRDEIAPTDLEMAAFVLVITVEAITHNAVLQRPEYLLSTSLEDEICAIVLRYLLPASAAAE